MFTASTTKKKLQARYELNSVQQCNYTLKIKDLGDSLGVINIKIEDDEMVQIYRGGLAQKYGTFYTVITTREKPPTFLDLWVMLPTEENHVQTKSSMSEASTHMIDLATVVAKE